VRGHEVVIQQAYPELKWIRKFAVEYWQDAASTACHRGENTGAKCSARFNPVTARRVRPNIARGDRRPSLW
jgi:hypothetical protein